MFSGFRQFCTVRNRSCKLICYIVSFCLEYRSIASGFFIRPIEIISGYLFSIRILPFYKFISFFCICNRTFCCCSIFYDLVASAYSTPICVIGFITDCCTGRNPFCNKCNIAWRHLKGFSTIICCSVIFPACEDIICFCWLWSCCNRYFLSIYCSKCFRVRYIFASISIVYNIELLRFYNCLHKIMISFILFKANINTACRNRTISLVSISGSLIIFINQYLFNFITGFITIKFYFSIFTIRSIVVSHSSRIIYYSRIVCIILRYNLYSNSLSIMSWIYAIIIWPIS